MEFLELKNISERSLEIANPTAPEKLLRAGRVGEMREGGRVIDFGSGYGEALTIPPRARMSICSTDASMSVGPCMCGSQVQGPPGHFRLNGGYRSVTSRNA